MPQPTRSSTHPDQNQQQSQQAMPLEGAVGASDATNGGGSGSGIPDGESALRTGDTMNRGNVAEDRKKLFPDAPAAANVGNEKDHPTKE